MINQTIAAIATPLGPGGIGIVRISGPSSCSILNRLFKKHLHDISAESHDICEGFFRSHRVYYGKILEPGNGAVIDEVLALYMKGPKSYTREDVVEIHSHSGFVVLDRILSAVIDSGAILAGPGEFTKRAFLSGRIDLSQAEAIIDLINAPCETAANMASQQVTGGIRDIVERLTTTLRALQARCEAWIEFSEIDADNNPVPGVCKDVRRSVLPIIAQLIQRQKETAIYREGFHLAIAGSPNVGKSSLLNKLVQREAAIVSEVPGTTRDIVREYLSINGVPVVLCDTAGIHESQDPVECIGIEKAREQIHRADLVLLVLDATRSLNLFEEKLLEDLKKYNCIVVLNKEDVVQEEGLRKIEKKLAYSTFVKVSAKHGSHIDQLKEIIFKDIVLGQVFDEGQGVSPNLRQRKLLEKAKETLQQLTGSGGEKLSIELVGDVLNNAIDGLGMVSGKREQADLYDHIFSQFCIGK
jgi:tRNA modification GTPase